MTDDPLADFAAEAEELVERFLEQLEQLDPAGAPPAGLVNGLFRSVHSLKGLAGLVGRHGLAHFAHEIENVLDLLRRGRLRLGPDLVDLLYESAEHLSIALRGDGADEGELARQRSHVLARLDMAAARLTIEPQRGLIEGLDLPEELADLLTEYERDRIESRLAGGAALFILDASFPIDRFEEDLSALTAALSQVGEVVTTVPRAAEGDLDTLGFQLLVASDVDTEGLRDVVGRFGGSVTPVEGRAAVPLVPPADAQLFDPRAPTQVAEPAGDLLLTDVGEDDSEEISLFGRLSDESSSVAGEMTFEYSAAALRPDRAPGEAPAAASMRLDIDRIDRVMSDMADVMISRSELARLGFQARAWSRDFTLADAIDRVVRQLDRRLGRLQQHVLGLRMVPLSTVFARLTRIVRQVASLTGKSVQLIEEGGDAEIDRILVDQLMDPLIHIVRNAIDHGIEDEAARILAGKPEKGTITLRAETRGHVVRVEIEDDGAGLDLDRLASTARTRGLLSREARPSRQQLLNLLFEPGFSTASQVSELSGRGVGLDVVRDRVARLNGTIEIESQRHAGTRFTLVVPASLAILSILMVRSREQLFALPMLNVRRVLQGVTALQPAPGGKACVVVDGRPLPVASLADLLALEGGGSDPLGPLLLIEAGGKSLVIRVDEVIERRDVVVKSLGDWLGPTPGIAGAAELGEQRLALVLDVGDLVLRPVSDAPVDVHDG